MNGLLVALLLTVVAQEDARVLRDVEYAKVGDHSLKLDLNLPAKAEPAPPLLVWIHGGGWRAGDKKGNPLRYLVGEGYAVASINYRLTQVAPFPAQIHDCKGAIRWLRANAEKYGYDARRIGIGGGSAGGHLVALLGTSSGVKELEGDVGGNGDRSSEVQAVVDLYGPTDFPAFAKENPRLNDPESPVTKLFGGTCDEKSDLAKLASPTMHVGKGDAPLLILHGREDPLVPVSQSTLLHETYTKAGLESSIEVIDGARHGGRKFFEEKYRKMISGFFDKHVRRTADR